MRRAIELGEIGSMRERTGGPFGAVIVKDGVIVGEGFNHVVAENDPTWHGEIGAIRDACKRLKTFDLSGATLYTSSEPCPMCLSAIMWARIDRFFYAALCSDAATYGGFDDVNFFDEIRKPAAERTIPSAEILRDEAVELFKRYKASQPTHY